MPAPRIVSHRGPMPLPSLPCLLLLLLQLQLTASLRVGSAWPSRTCARSVAPRASDIVPHAWETEPLPTFDYEATAPLLESGGLFAGIAACQRRQGEVLPLLDELRKFDFFSLYSADLLSSCSYMPQTEEPCSLDACEIEPSDDVPEVTTARDTEEYEFELDGWARWDQPSDFAEYYDLRLNPEGNTGYDGSRVWRFIHNKICFQEDDVDHGQLDDDANGWRRDFNRAISGMHAAVSAQVIADMDDEEERFEQYRRRLRDEPGAVSNLYFAYMLTLCAIKDAAPRLDVCNYLGEGDAVRPTMQQLTASALLADPAVQLAAQNLREHAQSADEQLWQARLRMRDVLRIMNCVQCNLCRLHGKVVSLGVASALQVLLGKEGQGGDATSLNRIEVAALVATAGKLGAACKLVEGYGALDGEVALAQTMFGRFDADGSGEIDAGELRALLTSLGKEQSDNELAVALAALDTDGDGSISYEEFLWWWSKGFSFEALAGRGTSKVAV